jgi:hypothetical protein
VGLMIMPGEFERDGYNVLDIHTESIRFPAFDKSHGVTDAPLAPGSMIEMGSAPEGILIDVRQVPDPRDPENPIDTPVLQPGFASIDVAFWMGDARTDADSPGITNSNLRDYLKKRTVQQTRHPAQLLHPSGMEASYAALLEELDNPNTIGRQTVHDRNQQLLHSVIATSPSVIERHRSNEPRFVTSIPLTVRDPSDPFVEVDIMVELDSSQQIPPYVIVDSCQTPYDSDRYTRLVVGSLSFGSPHPVSPDGTRLDYQRLNWRLEAAETSVADPNVNPDGLPKLAALILKTSCIDITTIRTPAQTNNYGGVAGVDINQLYGLPNMGTA